jgi:hypothetical protein
MYQHKEEILSQAAKRIIADVVAGREPMHLQLEQAALAIRVLAASAESYLWRLRAAGPNDLLSTVEQLVELELI